MIQKNAGDSAFSEEDLTAVSPAFKRMGLWPLELSHKEGLIFLKFRNISSLVISGIIHKEKFFAIYFLYRVGIKIFLHFS